VTWPDLLVAPPRRDTVTLDEAARVRLGAAATTPVDLLLKLALDPSLTVRTALAINPAAPPAVLSVLARDADERVRALLARKLAALAPCLNESERSRLNQQTIEALGHLVEDTAVRVRAAIAEVVKEMPNAPRELVLRLAHDTALQVSEPVIRLSPILTQEDLLSLLAASRSPEIALAVARRPSLTEDVADALAETADASAIRAMLLNHSAQIRESTLDALIARAAQHVAWHAPLVRRPSLSARAAEALSRIVADALLAELASRADLAPSVAADLRARLNARLGQPTGAKPSAAATPTDTATPTQAATPTDASTAGTRLRRPADRNRASRRRRPRRGTAGRRHAGSRGRRAAGAGRTRCNVAQRQGRAEPGLEGRVQHAARGPAANLVGAAGTRRAAGPRSGRHLPTGDRGDAMADPIPEPRCPVVPSLSVLVAAPVRLFRMPETNSPDDPAKCQTFGRLV
jgi:uncharacterized protein (DUF2336 family)